jgi:phosphoglycolate phosphatase
VTEFGEAESRSHRLWPEAVVFDLDGTLIDSAADIAIALNRALSKRGLAHFTVEKVKEMIGGGVPKLVERALLAHGVSRIGLLPLATDFIHFYREDLTVHTRLYEGARELLERLKGEGRKLGLCTNKQHDLTVQTLKQLDIAQYFAAVVGERFGRPRKPDPAPLRNILNILGASVESAVMVGDSAADVGCAKAAGVACVLVNFGYSPADAETLGADAVVASLADLPRCLAGLKAQNSRTA